MKLRMLASELVDPEIELISLVKRGANMEPFKIIKSDDEHQGDGLRDRVLRLFGKSDEPLRVSAMFAHEKVAARAEPLLKAAGYRVDLKQGPEDGLVTYLQAEGDVRAPESFARLGHGVVAGLSGVVKGFNPYGLSTAVASPSASPGDASQGQMPFMSRVVVSGFYSLMSAAYDALRSGIAAVVDSAESPDDIVSGVADETSQFKQYVNALAAAIPPELFSVEKSLAKEFGGSTVQKTGDTSVSEGADDMKNQRLREAVTGDLEGLDDVIKTGDAKDTKEDQTAQADASKAAEAQKAADAEAAKAASGDGAEGAQKNTEGDAAGDAADAPLFMVTKVTVDGKEVEKAFEYTVDATTGAPVIGKELTAEELAKCSPGQRKKVSAAMKAAGGTGANDKEDAADGGDDESAEEAQAAKDKAAKDNTDKAKKDAEDASKAQKAADSSSDIAELSKAVATVAASVAALAATVAEVKKTSEDTKVAVKKSEDRKQVVIRTNLADLDESLGTPNMERGRSRGIAKREGDGDGIDDSAVWNGAIPEFDALASAAQSLEDEDA